MNYLYLNFKSHSPSSDTSNIACDVSRDPNWLRFIYTEQVNEEDGYWQYYGVLNISIHGRFVLFYVECYYLNIYCLTKNSVIKTRIYTYIYCVPWSELRKFRMFVVYSMKLIALFGQKWMKDFVSQMKTLLVRFIFRY